MEFRFEPLTPEWRDDPYPKLRELRDVAPVHWSPEARCFCVSRHADVMAILKAPETFSSQAMRKMLLQGGEDEPPQLSFEVLRFIARMIWHTRFRPGRFAETRNLIAEDGAGHVALRNVVNRGFTPKRVAAWEARVSELARSSVAGLAGRERFDIVRELAVPLPVTIIAEFLGIESERREDFKRWTDGVIWAITTKEGHEDRFNAESTRDLFEMMAYVRSISRKRRKAPQDDLISVIATGPEALDDYEVLHFVLLLLLAGNETTTNLIGSMVSALLDHPEQLARLLREPERVDDAVEETLRYQAPVHQVFRAATREVELHGVRIPKDAVIAVQLGSANRDEREFEDPDVFDLDRRPKSHVGFGFGKHFCLGSSLARLEARTALRALLPELACLRHASDKREWVDSFLVRGPRTLELERVEGPAALA